MRVAFGSLPKLGYPLLFLLLILACIPFHYFFYFFRGATWTCTGLYANPLYTQRLSSWNYLSNLSDSIFDCWLIVADFNEIFLPREQRGGTFLPSRATALTNFIEHCELLDLASIGGKFTWHQTHGGIGPYIKNLTGPLQMCSGALTFFRPLLRSFVDTNPTTMQFSCDMVAFPK